MSKTLNRRVEILEHIRAIVETAWATDTTIGNVLSTSFEMWHRYLGFLDEIIDRYFTSCSRRMTDSQALHALVDSHPNSVLPESEAGPLVANLQRSANLVDLEIETFHLFAKILLDRIADTFGFYFSVPWTDRGSTHSELTRRFETICASRGLSVSARSDLKTLLDGLNSLIRWRNKEIEHPSEPRRILGQTSSAAGTVRTTITVLYPTPDELRRPEDVFKSSQTPGEILEMIESYTITMLGFLDDNRLHSVFGHGMPSA